MVDRAIKVGILEGDFAAICDLGFPLALSLQLQTNALKLSEAIWVFWLWLFCQSLSGLLAKWVPKKRRRRRKPKASTTVDVATSTLFLLVQPISTQRTSHFLQMVPILSTAIFHAFGPWNICCLNLHQPLMNSLSTLHRSKTSQLVMFLLTTLTQSLRTRSMRLTCSLVLKFMRKGMALMEYPTVIPLASTSGH